MGDDDALDRPATHHFSEMLFPKFMGRGYAVAGINDGPARCAVVIAIFKQPQIDVIERKWQRHADPVDAGGNQNGFARCGRRFVWVRDHRLI